MIFRRQDAEVCSPHSAARADSFLPKAKHPFADITGDDEQVAIAKCGIGQLFLKTNKDRRLASYGDIVCDVSFLGDYAVREHFEKLGASAVFNRDNTSGKWTLAAIDWRHGGKTVTPSDNSWEHV